MTIAVGSDARGDVYTEKFIIINAAFLRFSEQFTLTKRW